jgi:hypothetical protein
MADEAEGDIMKTQEEHMHTESAISQIGEGPNLGNEPGGLVRGAITRLAYF